MKKIIILCIAIMFMAGCASVSFDSDTGRIDYTRIGDQHIQGFEMTKDGDSVTVKMKGSQSNADALTEAIKVISVLSTK